MSLFCSEGREGNSGQRQREGAALMFTSLAVMTIRWRQASLNPGLLPVSLALLSAGGRMMSTVVTHSLLLRLSTLDCQVSVT